MHPPELPPHKDRYGEPCRGDARSSRRGAESVRRCLGCGRLESYEPDAILVVFKKGVTAMDAVRFLGQFKMNGRQPRIGGKAEHEGFVVLFASIPLAGSETLEHWILALESPGPGGTTSVLFASRVLKVDFEIAAGGR